MARKYKNPPIQVEALERLYTFTCRLAVQSFIEKHAFLASVLVEAYEQIQSYFPLAPMYLEVVGDPEAGAGDGEVAGPDELVLSIATRLEPTEALSTLDRFDSEWWLDALPRAYGKLTINLEFR